MASKRELADRALALSEQLGVNVTVEGLNHKSLEQLVEQLEQQAAALAAANTTQGAGDQGASTKPPDAAPALPLVPKLRAEQLEVSPRHSLTCARGVLGPGKRLREGDCSQESLEAHYLSGALVKNADAKKAETAPAASSTAAPAPTSSSSDSTAQTGEGAADGTPGAGGS